MGGLVRSRVTPNALTTAGVLLCAVASVLVYFEYRNEILFYWSGAFIFVVGSIGGLNHGSGLIELASNPYAAMPSLHAADALIVGITLAYVCRNKLAKLAWLLWPLWVWFSVMATANHFWLDVVAGVGVALVALAIVYRRWLARALLPI
jgi:membrane-associated phospholipid phosphatase